MEKLKENLYVLAPQVYATVFPEYEDLGNGGIIVTEKGVVLIDTDVRSVDRVEALIRDLTDEPVKYLINTHHAFDHSSANCLWAAKGVTIVASTPCREAMIAHGELNFNRWSNRVPEVRGILAKRKITVEPPHITFTERMEFHLGEMDLELAYHGHAHSPGDIYIYLPRQKVLFAGDLLWVGFFPNVREADVPNQIKVVDELLKLPVDYYVPGHGDITSDRASIVRMRDFLVSLYDTVARGVETGKTIEEINLDAEGLAEGYPDWQGKNFLNTAIEVLYRTLKEKKQ